MRNRLFPNDMNIFEKAARLLALGLTTIAIPLMVWVQVARIRLGEATPLDLIASGLLITWVLWIFAKDLVSPSIADRIRGNK